MKALQGRITTLSSSAKGGKLAKYCMLPQTDEKAKEKPFRAENDSVRSQRFSAVHEVMMLCEVCMFHAEKRNLLLFLHSDARNRRDFFLYAFFLPYMFFLLRKKTCLYGRFTEAAERRGMGPPPPAEARRRFSGKGLSGRKVRQREKAASGRLFRIRFAAPQPLHRAGAAACYRFSPW